MRQAVRAIIVKDDQLLVIRRNKFGEEYDTLPGGGIDIGEEPLQALIRELREETSIEVSNPRLVIIERAGNPWGDQYIYLCNYVSGEPKLAEDSEEATISRMGKNLYVPAWLPMKQFETTIFRSTKLQQTILRCNGEGWPEAVIELAG